MLLSSLSSSLFRCFHFEEVPRGLLFDMVLYNSHKQCNQLPSDSLQLLNVGNETDLIPVI